MMLLLLSPFSRVRLCASPQTPAHQAPPSLGFSRQEHRGGLSFPSPTQWWELNKKLHFSRREWSLIPLIFIKKYNDTTWEQNYFPQIQAGCVWKEGNCPSRRKPFILKAPLVLSSSVELWSHWVARLDRMSDIYMKLKARSWILSSWREIRASVPSNNPVSFLPLIQIL